MAKRRFQAPGGFGIRIYLDGAQRSTRHDLAAVKSGARPKIDNVIGTPHCFLVVLDNYQRIAFVSQRGERFEQLQVVTRVQTDGGLVQDVKDAAQIRPKLRSQPDSLGLAPAQCFC